MGNFKRCVSKILIFLMFFSFFCSNEITTYATENNVIVIDQGEESAASGSFDESESAAEGNLEETADSTDISEEADTSEEAYTSKEAVTTEKADTSEDENASKEADNSEDADTSEEAESEEAQPCFWKTVLAIMDHFFLKRRAWILSLPEKHYYLQIFLTWTSLRLTAIPIMQKIILRTMS